MWTLTFRFRRSREHGVGSAHSIGKRLQSHGCRLVAEPAEGRVLGAVGAQTEGRDRGLGLRRSGPLRLGRLTVLGRRRSLRTWPRIQLPGIGVARRSALRET